MHTPDVEDDFYFQVFGKKIVKQFRDEALKRFGVDFFSPGNHLGAPVAPKRPRSVRQPTFWEFVQFILTNQPTRMDEHWTPMSIYCPICRLPFNHILHLESIQEEEAAFKAKVAPDKEMLKLHKNHKKEKIDQDTLVAKYFDLLSAEDIRRLCKLYEWDLKLFGYSFTHKNVTCF